MNLYTLLGQIRDALNADSTLDTWLNAQFTKDMIIFMGTDESDPPGIGDCPCVNLHPSGRTAGDSAEQKNNVIAIRLAIQNATKSTSGNVVTLAGLTQIVTFCTHVVRILTTDTFKASAGCDGIEIEIGYDAFEYFPMFTVYLDFNFWARQYNKGNVYT